MERGDAKLMERDQRLRAAIARLPRAKLVERQDVTDDLMVIKLQPEVEFPFKPGQYSTLGLESVERAYSIVSAPHEPYLEIFVELVPLPDGVLTPMMWKLNVGDSMSIRPRAKGVFTFEEGYHQHLMVATVTGIAPFISIIRDYFYHSREGHRFYVLMGASYHDEFTYKDELDDLAKHYPDTVVYVPTVSRPTEARNAVWEGVKGRANTVVEEYIERYELDPQSTLIYACGHPGMIEDVKERLTPSGFTIREGEVLEAVGPLSHPSQSALRSLANIFPLVLSRSKHEREYVCLRTPGRGPGASGPQGP